MGHEGRGEGVTAFLFGLGSRRVKNSSPKGVFTFQKEVENVALESICGDFPYRFCFFGFC